MKATGIVRRIDDLGRVVIPKEIRRTLRIKEGDPLEIFTDKDGEVVLKRYAPIGELNEFASEYAEALYSSTGFVTIMTDRDSVIAVAGGSKRELEGRAISPELDSAIATKSEINIRSKNDYVPITSEGGERAYSVQMIQPVVSGGDSIGSIIFCSGDASRELGDIEKKLLQAASNFLGKQMEQ